MKKSLSKNELAKIQELVGTVSEADLQYVDAFVSDQLGIFIPSVGFCQYAIRAGHTHPSYSFVVFFSEEQNFLKTAIHLPEGHYLGACLSPDLPHEEEETDTFTRYAALFIDRDFYERLRQNYCATEPTQPYFWQQFPVAPDTMTDIKRFIDECDHSQRGTQPYLNVLAELITHGLLRGVYPGGELGQPMATRLDVAAVIDYMEDHFSDKLTVATLARKMGLSPSQFTRRFKHETGSSPIDFFLELRIKKAQKLLRSGSKTMTQIAQDCGFGSTAHFSATFKKHTKLSPTDYQQLYQKS
ncbi:AraC family transcriptional regulator [Acetobacterium sp.]|uniref:AraC family transcriptional regulator n=1 Tax=Acetobacterium sp. TaxID=1872094 RepID=UPI0027266666|nr:AraC family transcriptional regulator [Acetobacterium sp.]MDO9493641.1 AraC family transcriptional regulator [Acetobacterium sp.]